MKTRLIFRHKSIKKKGLLRQDYSSQYSNFSRGPVLDDEAFAGAAYREFLAGAPLELGHELAGDVDIEGVLVSAGNLAGVGLGVPFH